MEPVLGVVRDLPVPPELEARERGIVTRQLKDAGLDLLFESPRKVKVNYGGRDEWHLEPDKVKQYIVQSGDGTYVVVIEETWARVPGPKPALSLYHFPRVIGVVTDLEKAKTVLTQPPPLQVSMGSAIYDVELADLDAGIGRLDNPTRSGLEKKLDSVFKAAQPEVRALYGLPAQP